MARQAQAKLIHRSSLRFWHCHTALRNPTHLLWMDWVPKNLSLDQTCHWSEAESLALKGSPNFWTGLGDIEHLDFDRPNAGFVWTRKRGRSPHSIVSALKLSGVWRYEPSITLCVLPSLKLVWILWSDRPVPSAGIRNRHRHCPATMWSTGWFAAAKRYIRHNFIVWITVHPALSAVSDSASADCCASYTGRALWRSPVYFSDVIVSANSNITSICQLAQKSFCYNDPGSNSGHHMVRHFCSSRDYRCCFGSGGAVGRTPNLNWMDCRWPSWLGCNRQYSLGTGAATQLRFSDKNAGDCRDWPQFYAATGSCSTLGT